MTSDLDFVERLRFGWDCYKNYINYKENTND